MKNIINSYKKTLTLASALVLGTLGSCSLDEEVYSIYTPETFYSNEKEVLSSLSGVYRNFAQITGMGAEYRTLELSADQVVVHGKIQGWWANSDFEQLMEHEWDATHAYIAGTWNTLFGTVGQANALIDALDASGLEGIEGPRAELQALRAFAYFYLVDLYGNVPIFTAPKVDPLDLPTQNTRAEVVDFIIAELETALPNLPSQTEVGSEYYGRFTREAGYTLLATLYLNAEVYTGTAQWDKAIEYADMVINSGAYLLLPDYFDNFVHDNEENAEFIFGGIYTPNIPGGIGHPLVQKVLPGISGGLFGLPYTPQNGFGTRPSIFDLYEDQDDRKNMFLGHGPMKDPRNGEVVMVERVVPDNNSNLYREGSSSEGPVPYEIIPATGIRNQPMNAGIKWIKWGLDPNTNGGNASNDIAFFRYADVLLIKAEALARQGNFGEATTLVNQVRERSNASTLTTVTLEDILNERGRELAFELARRRDLIRFGKFNDAWEFKKASESFRTLYPIPSTAIDANPNLQQNQGYQ
ncbi:RagB/SusD family nutrient uptake outer membrane protein [Echinicola soli]|uniref:RagB/SusD family nutrient uptake outer membrane protein n=1 Tax=Echinicola soli TaxID=2591634 RepID=A0A514CJ19_9BACT|nr:RagB/SusD family nutrient uptake outer membrane protein [Echinicola soli]QDH79819.1 RagB/SusD family nutrient uptake outer membrane protein [Echinicola soli]